MRFQFRRDRLTNRFPDLGRNKNKKLFLLCHPKLARNFGIAMLYIMEINYFIGDFAKTRNIYLQLASDILCVTILVMNGIINIYPFFNNFTA